MAIIKQGSTTLNAGAKGQKGDMPSFTINGTPITDGSAIVIAGGEGSINTFIPTSKADLENVANAGKLANIETDIDLGGLDVTLADGITLYSSGGKLTNFGILTCSNTNFGADRIDRAIIDDSGTLDGTYNSSIIWADWFGAKTDAISAGYDNHEAFTNALKIVSYNGGTLRVGAGLYYTRNNYAVDQDRPWIYPRRELTLYNGAKLIGEGWKHTSIKLILNDSLERYNLFVISNNAGGSIEDIRLIGDKDTRLDPNPEGMNGISIVDNNHGFKVKNCLIEKFCTDGIYATQSQDLGNGALTWTTEGGVDDSGNLIVDTSSYRSVIFDLTSQTISNNHVFVTGASLGSYQGVNSKFATVYFYNDASAFVGKSSNTSLYRAIQLPTDATKGIVVIGNQGMTGIGDMYLRSPSISMNVIIEDNIIQYNFRNGISNLSQGAIITKNVIRRNGGRSGGPGYGIDIEDGYQLNNNIIMSDNTFEDNYAGDITLPWSTDVRIINNTFNGHPSQGGGVQDSNFRNAYQVLFSGNTVRNTTITASRNGMITNNYFYNCAVKLPNQYSRASYNIFRNSSISLADSDASVVPSYGTSYNENNSFIIDNQYSNNVMIDELTTKDVIVEYIYGTQADAPKLGKSSVIDTIVDLVPRTTDNLKVLCETPFDSRRTEGMAYSNHDIKNSVFEQSLLFWGGQKRSFTLTNNTVYGWIDLKESTSPYTNDGTEWYEYKINGGTLTSDASYINSIYCGLRTPERDINLTVENLTIDITDAVANNFLALKHNGTTIFRNCTFKQDVASDWDLWYNTLSISVNTTPNPIIFEDCEFINIPNVNGRTGDAVVYTKSHSNMPVYADNATAIADGYPVGYMYRTSTGLSAVTFTP